VRTYFSCNPRMNCFAKYMKGKVIITGPTTRVIWPNRLKRRSICRSFCFHFVVLFSTCRLVQMIVLGGGCTRKGPGTNDRSIKQRQRELVPTFRGCVRNVDRDGRGKLHPCDSIVLHSSDGLTCGVEVVVHQTLHGFNMHYPRRPGRQNQAEMPRIQT